MAGDVGEWHPSEPTEQDHTGPGKYLHQSGAFRGGSRGVWRGEREREREGEKESKDGQGKLSSSHCTMMVVEADAVSLVRDVSTQRYSPAWARVMFGMNRTLPCAGVGKFCLVEENS